MESDSRKQAASLTAKASLPRALTRLLGREAEIDAACSLVKRPDIRLLTIVGPGGVGKTRLTLGIADAAAASFPDGVWFVPLENVPDAGAVGSAIAQAMGITQSDLTPVMSTLELALRDRELLLVLDNIEHLTAAGPALVHLLARCPGLTIVVTSRCLLNVSGEHAFPLLPLAIPPARAFTPDELAIYPSVQLFVARGAAARPGFTLTSDNAGTIAAMCQQLDGLPLGIELAASWLRLFSPTDLANQLQRRFAILIGGRIDHPARLRTMRNAIAWGHDLLPDAVKPLFHRLAHVARPFTIEDALAMASAGEPLEVNVVEGLATLVDHSFIQPRSSSDDAGQRNQFVMLQTIREFGIAQLRDDQLSPIFEQKAVLVLLHAEAGFACMATDKDELGLRQLADLEPDAIASMEWAEANGRAELLLQIVHHIKPYWARRGQLRRGHGWMERALAMAANCPPQLQAALLYDIGGNAYARGLIDEARWHAKVSLELAESVNDPLLIADALLLLARATENDDLVQAIAFCEQAVALIRASEDRKRLPAAIGNLGVLLRERGEHTRATELFAESLMLDQQQGYLRGMARSYLDMAESAYHLHPRDAVDLFRKALAGFVTASDDGYAALSLVGLAACARQLGHADLSIRLLGLAELTFELTGYRVPPDLQAVHDRVVADGKTVLGDEQFAALRLAGRTLTLAQARDATDILVAEEDTVPANAGPAPAGTEPLTRRETEVLHLLVNGHSNRDIGDTLSISTATVKVHVASILAKLDVPTRTAAAAFAHRHGLVRASTPPT